MARPLRSTMIPTPGDAKRVHLPHPEILLGSGRRPAADRRRQAGTQGCALRRQGDRVHRCRRHDDFRQEGRQPARHRTAGRCADRKGPRRSRRGARRRGRLGRAVLHPAPRRSGRGAQDRPRPCSADGQDRKAAGCRAAGGNHRAFRCADGGARRPRRRNAARGRARHPEADHPRRAPRRQAGGGRHPDAGIDDHRAGADARRGIRRVHRRFRGRRRHHAVGRIRRRANIRSRRCRR